MRNASVLLVALLAGCGPQQMVSPGGPPGSADASMSGPGDDAGALPDDVTPDVGPDGGAPAEPDMGMADMNAGAIAVGGVARVTADSLNLRTGAGTTNPVILVMPCGARVDVAGGPDMGWWMVKYMTQTGWASGKYLVAESAFSPAMCARPADMAGMQPAPDGGLAPEVRDIFDRAKLGVGYSYYWGHGSWRADGQQHGTCTGSCPSCTHGGSYGADCSGFVAKCWQIPSPSPITQDLHPYSTYNFYNQTTHWSVVQRTKIQPADAMTYNANGAGHIVLFESGNDPWGNVWLYEARGCATGIVHNLRTVANTYITIRREGL